MNIFKDVAAKKYRLAIWSMALGIISVCKGFGILALVLGVLALIFAIAAKKDYHTVETSAMSTVGFVTGLISTVVAGTCILIPIVTAIIVAIITIAGGAAAILPRFL